MQTSDGTMSAQFNAGEPHASGLKTSGEHVGAQQTFEVPASMHCRAPYLGGKQINGVVQVLAKTLAWFQKLPIKGCLNGVQLSLTHGR